MFLDNITRHDRTCHDVRRSISSNRLQRYLRVLPLVSRRLSSWLRSGSLITLFVAGLAPLVIAQQAPGSDALQEIVVTATKRESTVQTTPMSLTALSEAGIQERGLTDMTEVAQSVPGLAMRSSGPGQTEFEMRGVASTGGNSPTVGFYFDDTPLTAPASSNNGKVVIDPNLFDLNRIEVLRGPQGTLYGSGSMGGTIKLVPNAPDVTRVASAAELIFGGTDGGGFNRGENAMVNLPFGGGTAALRIVLSESHDSGWIDRVVIANGQFPLETDNNQVRGNVLAAPVAADYKTSMIRSSLRRASVFCGSPSIA